jgi:hypothetical protein
MQLRKGRYPRANKDGPMSPTPTKSSDAGMSVSKLEPTPRVAATTDTTPAQRTIGWGTVVGVGGLLIGLTQIALQLFPAAPVAVAPSPEHTSAIELVMDCSNAPATGIYAVLYDDSEAEPDRNGRIRRGAKYFNTEVTIRWKESQSAILKIQMPASDEIRTEKIPCTAQDADDQ